MNSLKRLLWCVGLIFLAILAETIYIEWALDSTSRRFVKQSENVKKGFILKSDIALYDTPRLYRKKHAYDDLNELIYSLLYIRDNTDDFLWGISSAINLISQEVKKYPRDSNEYLFLLQKKIAISNRSPEHINDFNSLQEDVDDLVKLSSSHEDIHQEAYSFIESMLYAANRFSIEAVSGNANKSETLNKIENLYTKAVDTLKRNPVNEEALNIIKFSYYHGYAKCLLGDENGGKDMLAAVDTLSKKSDSFDEAMLINWDWAFVGNLTSPRNRGHFACGKYAQEIRSLTKSFY